MADGDGLTARPEADLPHRVGRAIELVGPSSFEVARATCPQAGAATDAGMTEADVLAALHRLEARGEAVAEWAPDKDGRVRRRYRARRPPQLLR